MKLIGFLVFFALGACSGGGIFSGGGGGGGVGGALDGNDPPPDTTQNTPLDEVQVGPVVDYDMALLMGHCSLEGASCPATIPNELSEEIPQEEGCYQVKFEFQLTVAGNPLPDSIIRIVETFKDIYKDFKTNAEGKAQVQLTVGPNRVFKFYKALPAPEYNPDDPWKDCPGLNCIASTYVPIQTFLDETCQAILYPDSSPGLQFKKINGVIFHSIGPLLNQ